METEKWVQMIDLKQIILLITTAPSGLKIKRISIQLSLYAIVTKTAI